MKGIENSDFLVQKATDGQFGRVTKATNCEVLRIFELIRLDLKSIRAVFKPSVREDPNTSVGKSSDNIKI